MTTTTTRVELTEFTIRHPEGEDSVVYRQGLDDADALIGNDDGHLMVRLGIDGSLTIVSTDPGGTAPLTLIERSIAALTEIWDQLSQTNSRVGYCLVHGDWGRCTAREGHEGAHRFPTEAQWRSVNHVVPFEVSA